MLWITDFAHNGVLENDREAKTIYKNTMTVAMIGSAILLPAVGMIIDIVPARIIFPVAFFTRGLLAGQFYFIEDPSSTYSYVLIISVVISSTVQYICVQAFFLKNLPGNIRGVMVSAFWFAGNLGSTVFALAGGIMFDKLGRSSPFIVVSFTDLIVFTLSIVLLCMGKLKNY